MRYCSENYVKPGILNSEHTHTVTDGHPILATASSTGHIALWDLISGGRLLHIVRGAHDGAVTALEWVPGQPVLISSGEDNSVKVRMESVVPHDSPSNICKAMAVRLPYGGSTLAQVPVRTSCAAAPHPILRRRRQAASYGLSGSQFEVHERCTRLA